MNEDLKNKLGKLKGLKSLVNFWPAALTVVVVLAMAPQTRPVLQEIPALLTESVLGVTNGDDSAAKDQKKTEETEEATGVGDYEDGEYEGSSNGYGGTIKVKVTVKDKQITNVEILEASGETSSFFNQAKGVIDKVLKAQTWEVDVVSGATYSSRGILGAIQNALTGASVVNAEAEKTQAAGSLTSDEFEDPADGYADGTYSGSATGFGGSISVEVTISGGKISSINVTSAGGETASYLNNAKGVISSIISKQSPNVDTVSGATYSSNGIINAVKAALKKAAAAKSASTTTESSTASDSSSSSSLPKEYILPLAEIRTSPAESLQDGIYAGVGTGYGGKGSITAKVTVAGGLIRKIVIVSADGETQSYYEKAQNVINTILLKQSTDVDTISGATFSSRGILQAVSQALSQSMPNSGDSSVMPAVTLADGTYTGVGEGFGGDVDVTVTVSGGRIVTISASGPDETENYFQSAEGILDKILQAQSSDVDVISGATYSSNGIKEAVREAINKAAQAAEGVKDDTAGGGTTGGSDTGNTGDSKTDENSDTGNTGGSTTDGSDTENTGGSKTDENSDTGNTGGSTTDAGGDAGNTGDNTGSTDSGNTGETTTPLYKDGTAWGIVACTGRRFNYQIKVTVVTENGVITKVDAVRYDDTSDPDYYDYNDECFKYASEGETTSEGTYTGVLDQIVQKQSADSIDVVSGATYSSNSIHYLQNYRLNYAKQLLKNGNDSILDIALKAGFGTAGYFDRVFKREMGMTPKQFAKNK